MNVPYNTGRVSIGIAYRRPLPTLSADAELIQTALLRNRMPVIRTDTSLTACAARFLRRLVSWIFRSRA